MGGLRGGAGDDERRELAHELGLGRRNRGRSIKQLTARAHGCWRLFRAIRRDDDGDCGLRDAEVEKEEGVGERLN